MWDTYTPHGDLFFVEMTVRDMHAGLTSEEALLCTRRVSSAVNAVGVRCRDLESGDRTKVKKLDEYDAPVIAAPQSSAVDNAREHQSDGGKADLSKSEEGEGEVGVPPHQGESSTPPNLTRVDLQPFLSRANAADADDCGAAITVQDVRRFLSCFFFGKSGAALSDAVLSAVSSSGLNGIGLLGMSEEELSNLLQLSRVHTQAIRSSLLSASRGTQLQDIMETATPRESMHEAAVPEKTLLSEKTATDATKMLAQLEERFAVFMGAVCRRCAYRDYACGCEQGEDNPAFTALRNYAAQYENWRETTLNAGKSADAHDALEEQPKWLVIDVTMGLVNNLLAYVNGLLLALCLGRALAVNTHDPYPLHPVLEFIVEADIPTWRGGTTRLSSANLFLDQASDLSQVTCGDFADVEAAHILYLRNANQDPHLIQSNPTCGAFLYDAFRGLPFFFLSHFVWSGQAELSARHTFVSTPSP
jgi:hypothetical protein